MVEKLTSFDPVLSEEPNVLILGSMPGGMSLEKGEYYGNPVTISGISFIRCLIRNRSMTIRKNWSL
ncbi:hypothetical protein ACFO3D_12840 [Virgibacillus kekensis]|uniref:Uncharacterized protein n=1 Tax=Virgibacillus kekensis TaxID=202261 RepID=A0ABV9DNE4_9BACI